MYTNVSRLVDTIIALLERNALRINRTVQVYQPSNNLNVYKGMRKTLPVDAYPSLEIEPDSGTSDWATTRAQRPRYTFKCTLTTKTDNEAYGVEYIATIANVLLEIMTSPENLQMRIIGETKWDPNGGMVDTYLLDSLVENVSYSATKSGTIRTCEFNWFALINETYPEFKWQVGESNTPTVIRPPVQP